MTNLEKYRSLLHDGVHGLLLTSRYSRMYAAEFDIAEGVAVVSAQGARYFTDSRYIESAQKNLKGFEVVGDRPEQSDDAGAEDHAGRVRRGDARL